VDSRNVDDLVELFIEDVQVGRHEKGRAALKEWFVKDVLSSNFKVSIHQVMNHVIDLTGTDRATGVVYCRDELELPDKWVVGVIQYWDEYERRGKSWYFRRRRPHRYYAVDALAKPTRGADAVSDAGMSIPMPVLPEAWPSWKKFWSELAGKPDRW
jgi:hypothetical protein